MKSFHATNAAGTCLWCGVKLRAQSTERGLKRDLAAYAKLYGEPARNGGRYTVARLQAHDRLCNVFGKHDGCFCTDGCAIAFGVTAARRGYRFQPQ
jgi:hypothetical protein